MEGRVQVIHKFSTKGMVGPADSLGVQRSAVL